MARNDVPITVVGNLTGDPEMRFTPAGAAVCRFTVAVNPRRFDKDAQEWKDGEPSFYSCTVWRQLAENVVESLAKGARVVVVGTLQQRQWENDKGEKRTSWDVTADAVGPDLSYATAKVNKVARNSRGEVPPDDPWASGTRSPAPAGADEEPPF